MGAAKSSQHVDSCDVRQKCSACTQCHWDSVGVEVEVGNKLQLTPRKREVSTPRQRYVTNESTTLPTDTSSTCALAEAHAGKEKEKEPPGGLASIQEHRVTPPDKAASRSRLSLNMAAKVSSKARAQRRHVQARMRKKFINVHPVLVVMREDAEATDSYSSSSFSSMMAPAISFLRAQLLDTLPVPWPRRQELQQELCTPNANDMVVAVSHMWYFQAHPDPLGEKAEALQDVLRKISLAAKPIGNVMLFIDFLGINQRPFNIDQEDRSEKELAAFGRALQAMPMVYLHSDAIILLDGSPTGVAPGDGQTRICRGSDLKGLKLLCVREKVQVVGRRPRADGLNVPGSQPCLFGRNENINSENKMLAVAPFDYVVKADEQSVADLDVDDIEFAEHVTVEKARYGKQSSTIPGDRGWIYLERFIAMVKVAMIAGEADRKESCVIFSDSASLLDEIRKEGKALRDAAAGGAESLAQALSRHSEILRTKVFTALSMDKANNTGGLGGAATSTPTSQRPADQLAVESIMSDMVSYLQTHWEAEARYLRRARIRKAVKHLVALARLTNCSTRTKAL
eukprot:TRINITY_DN67378_c0_g1_i1.p1 TRINITY_DN67378_c0_g1~~TRINITY_DN67378_c0_g1_i1.p1  ORF type:complete len:569 (+),score=102.82 TRINITY_DN67378_c0_g1_i1:64-1770(+)